jgi:hypothetical protein
VCKWSRISGSIGRARRGELVPMLPYTAECRVDGDARLRGRAVVLYRYASVLSWAKRRSVSAAWNRALICAAVCAFPASNR